MFIPKEHQTRVFFLLILFLKSQTFKNAYREIASVTRSGPRLAEGLDSLSGSSRDGAPTATGRPGGTARRDDMEWRRNHSASGRHHRRSHSVSTARRKPGCERKTEAGKGAHPTALTPAGSEAGSNTTAAAHAHTDGALRLMGGAPCGLAREWQVARPVNLRVGRKFRPQRGGALLWVTSRTEDARAPLARAGRPCAGLLKGDWSADRAGRPGGAHGEHQQPPGECGARGWRGGRLRLLAAAARWRRSRPKRRARPSPAVRGRAARVLHAAGRWGRGGLLRAALLLAVRRESSRASAALREAGLGAAAAPPSTLRFPEVGRRLRSLSSARRWRGPESARRQR